MYKRIASGVAGTVVGLFLISATVLAQQAPSHGKDMHHAHPSARDPISRNPVPTLPGQDAFGAIQEIVRILEADPATDWSKVNLDRLRQHLIDMNEVALRAGVKAEPVSGGLRMDITGTGRTEQAIRDMVGPHSNELNQMTVWSATGENIPGGLRLTVVAKDPADTKTIARIRGLGVIGLLVQGVHHQAHHLAMARGEAIAGHGH
jgi:hypothetical protein